MNIADAVAGLVARLLPTRSVDTIIKVVSKMTARLAAAEAAQNARAETLKRQADSLLSQAAAASAEAERAGALRSNFASLTTVGR